MQMENYMQLFPLLKYFPYYNGARFQTDEADLAQLILERDLKEHFFMKSDAAALVAFAVRNASVTAGSLSRQSYLAEIQKALQKNEQALPMQILPMVQKKLAIKNEMVSIHGGVSTMGTGRWAKKSHTREKQINVAPFLMSKYTVMQDEFESVMGYNPSYIKGQEFPAESISWYEAVEYCNKRSLMEELTPAYNIDKENPPSDYDDDRVYLGGVATGIDPLKWNVTWDRKSNGYRLPTQAEWEYACRAETTGDFYTGDFINTEQANFNNNHIMPVGQFAPNAWGLYDMHGNIWEWCWDSLEESSLVGTTSNYGTSPGRWKYKRMVRGGAYCYGSMSISSWYAMCREPYRLGYLGPYGIRLVRSKNIWRYIDG
jgi:formylglycine-generating enzyme required for sulfatase activity